MKKRYNILWIDDQHKELEGFADEAYQEGFDITAYASSREGMEYLENNLSAVDAIILDAKVFKDGPEDVASERGLSASIIEIARIGGKNRSKNIPRVIYTGQPDLQSNEDFSDRWCGIPIFSKNEPTRRIFDKLIELIDDSPDATVRNQYRAAYEACREGRIDPHCWELLAPVLRSVTNVEDLPKDSYNDVRNALEWVFRYLHRYCVIHEKLIDDAGRVNLQGVSFFLAGKPARLHSTNKDLFAKHTILPYLLVNSVKFILDVTQPGSHTEELEDANPGKPSIKAVNEYCPNHRLIQLVAIMTADFAEWSFNYVAANPDTDVNRSLWVEASIDISPDGESLECEGLVIQIDRFGNCFVDTRNVTETEGKNIRIRKCLSDVGPNLAIGIRVSTVSKDDPTKTYRDATSYRVLSQ
jgi:hypothetical protein